MYGISSLHDHILFFLAVILFVVVYVFVTTIDEFFYRVVIKKQVTQLESFEDLFNEATYKIKEKLRSRVEEGKSFENYIYHTFKYN
jgi:hypothetical protein